MRGSLAIIAVAVLFLVIVDWCEDRAGFGDSNDVKEGFYYRRGYPYYYNRYPYGYRGYMPWYNYMSPSYWWY